MMKRYTYTNSQKKSGPMEVGKRSSHPEKGNPGNFNPQMEALEISCYPRLPRWKKQRFPRTIWILFRPHHHHPRAHIQVQGICWFVWWSRWDVNCWGRWYVFFHRRNPGNSGHSGEGIYLESWIIINSSDFDHLVSSSFVPELIHASFSNFGNQDLLALWTKFTMLPIIIDDKW